MQEEVEQRVVTLIVNCSKLTEQELRKALSKLLAHLKTQRQTKQPHGKMTVKKLAAQQENSTFQFTQLFHFHLVR